MPRTIVLADDDSYLPDGPPPQDAVLTPAQAAIKEAKAKARREHLELSVLRELRLERIEEPVRQYRFHPERRWTFDFAWPDEKLALEVEGGTWVQGRHSRGAGYTSDCRKYNTAVVLGWRVLRATTDMIENGEVGPLVKRLIVPF